jgi:hypothetical protein
MNKRKHTTAKPKHTTAAQKLDAVGIDAICERIAECVTLQVIADDVGVSKWSLIQWINSDINHDAHTRAREAQAEKHASDILAISDEAEVEAKYDGDNVTLELSSAAVARNRLRVDTRKWLAAKMNAKKYGDKLTQELTGAGGGAIKIAAMDFKGLSDVELDTMHKMMLKATGNA